MQKIRKMSNKLQFVAGQANNKLKFVGQETL